jgi:hypothetical protein
MRYGIVFHFYVSPGTSNSLMEEIMGTEKRPTFARDITRFPETHPGAEKSFAPGCAGNRVPDLRRCSSVP